MGLGMFRVVRPCKTIHHSYAEDDQGHCARRGNKNTRRAGCGLRVAARQLFGLSLAIDYRVNRILVNLIADTVLVLVLVLIWTWEALLKSSTSRPHVAVPSSRDVWLRAR
jgi:hypothetical protein